MPLIVDTRQYKAKFERQLILPLYEPFDMPDQSYLKCGLATTWSFMSVVLDAREYFYNFRRVWVCCMCCAKAEKSVE